MTNASPSHSSPSHSSPSHSPLPPTTGPTILTNARLILEHELITGTIVFDETGILDISAGRSALPAAIDCEGDLIAPGIVEMHTDNLEKHLAPRPKVRWPNPIAAALANDAQMAAAGITTVFDAVCIGSYENTSGQRKEMFVEEIDAIDEAKALGLFRIDHYLHLRCELSDLALPTLVEPHRAKPIVKLVSLMDHTPGQRQWRDAKHLRTYMAGTGRSHQDIEDEISARLAVGAAATATNWPLMIEMFAKSGIVMASHDDTEEDHVAMAIEAGCSISEFPTTLEAARAAKAQGLSTIGGAPNIVRGGSHSGGVSMRTLVEHQLLDGLSSDYVPASLLQAAHILHQGGLPLPSAFRMISANVADMVGLADRGRLQPGKRSDLIRLTIIRDTPVVRRVWSNGRIAF